MIGRPAQPLARRAGPGSFEGGADVCVVGAGPVGQTCADALAARGLRVVVLEAGGAVATARANERCSTPVLGDDRYGELGWKAWRASGGTSWAWRIDVLGSGGGVRYAGVEPAVVRRSSPYRAWPLDVDELAQLQERALRTLDLPMAGDALDVRRSPTVPGLGEGLYVFGTADRFQAPRSSGPGPTVVLDATVTRLVPAADRSGAVRAVVYRDSAGRLGRVECRAVVLAANAVASAHLALRLREQVPAMAANTAIGHGLMDRPRVTGHLETPGRPGPELGRFALRQEQGSVVMTRWCTDPDAVAAGQPSAGFVIMPRDGGARGPGRGERALRWLLIGLPPRLVLHTPELGGGRLVEAFAAASRRSYRWRSAGFRRFLATGFDLEWPDWGASGWQECRRWAVTASVEQLPDPANRVELTDELDADGGRGARVVWGSPAGRQESAPALEAASRALGEAGIGTLRWPDGEGFDSVSSHHLMGTLCFGDDPLTSAADRMGLIRGTTNVFAAGAALFPTSGHANPTLTALSLALHVADAAADLVLAVGPHTRLSDG